MALRLEGECNRCGVCCFSPDRSAKCENLIVEGEVGKENATRCGVWDKLTPFMPIRMLRADGSLAYESFCANGWRKLVEDEFPIKLPGECAYRLVEVQK